MAVVAVLLVATLLARAAGAFGVAALRSWRAATRVGLAVMFLFTAAAHFNRMRDDLIAMVPPALPYPEHLVTFTGVCEILGAIGILIPRVRRWAGIGLILLLLALFPANVSAAMRNVTLDGRPVTALWLRLPMQVLFIGLTWWTTQGKEKP